ncbi:amidohydrolase family protein [Herbiconiux sp. CPCC 203386]|uniref:Amidohydrolase family protein n=1 Tax=Herbiconiux daphne TaxID=2970914 RepID=A0ABT2H445_9MICO|nr:amidohydrolase family protein [Herbiconiux daphne]
MRTLVDSHAHVWNRARTPIDWIDESLPEIDRDFSVAELDDVAGAAAGGSAGVRMGAAVLVQALNDAGETRDLLATARGPVVGWVDLAAHDVSERLDATRELPGGARLAGIRHLAHVDADPEWLLRPEVGRGLEALAERGLVFDLVVRAWQLPQAARLADAHPDLLFVLDHLGQPPAGTTDAPLDTDGNGGGGSAGGDGAPGFERWAADLRALARRPNVRAKVSGVAVRGAAASAARLERVGAVGLEAFGPHRLMFGSDWPLVRLADGYGAWLEQYLAWSSVLSHDERRSIDELAATEAYGLGRVAAAPDRPAAPDSAPALDSAAAPEAAPAPTAPHPPRPQGAAG